MAETIQEQLVTYLKDAHALEQMPLQMTQSAAKATDDPQLHDLFEHHHEETEEHERLIGERIEAHGESTSTLKDLGGRVAAMGKGMESMLPSDAPGRLARDGYVQEHTEIAAYELSAAWRSEPAIRRRPTWGGGSSKTNGRPPTRSPQPGTTRPTSPYARPAWRADPDRGERHLVETIRYRRLPSI